MPSKGVDYYSFIVSSDTSIKFSGPKVGGTTTSSKNFTKNHLEIDSSNLPWNEFTGTFEWDIIVNNSTVYSRKQDISSLTGNLEDGGDFKDMMITPAVDTSTYNITYGFYDAGSGVAGLTNADQAWVPIIPNLSGWMGNVAPPSSAQEQQPFSTFVLAAAHDAGMNTMNGVSLITSSATIAITIAALIPLLPIPQIAALLAANASDIMEDLAMTQKDSFTSMLNNGVRYFDFRPAYLLPGVRSVVPSSDDTLYHTHLVIPGARFDSFLQEVVAFLLANPSEIVVIRTSSSGIKLCEIPDADKITEFANIALAKTGLTLGDSSCFQTSIATLRAEGKRLILVQDNKKYDSYSDGAYATLNPQTIINNFNGMTTANQAGNDFTVLQCQGTAEGITSVLVYGATAANGSTSPLMSTKASFDMVTLPWIQQNALNNLKAPQNIMIMNDFIDGATTYTAYQLSMTRFAPSVAAARHVAAQTSLKSYIAREALLKGIVADQTAALSTAQVSKEDQEALDTLRAAQDEAEAARKAQEQMVAAVAENVAVLRI